MDDDSVLRHFEQLLVVFCQSRAKPRLRGIPVLVALDQARFIIRSRNRRNASRADEGRQTVGTLKMADEFEWEL